MRQIHAARPGGMRMTEIMTAILMIDMQKMYRDQRERDVFGWPPIWRLDEVPEECGQLLAAGRCPGSQGLALEHAGKADGPEPGYLSR
jgi:hypothetical protein